MIRDKIVEYLERNPEACDSVEGIQKWWLEGSGANLGEVSAALDRLVAEGHVERLHRHSREVFRRVTRTAG